MDKLVTIITIISVNYVYLLFFDNTSTKLSMSVFNAIFTLQAVAGLIADARQVIRVARIEASNYRFIYSQPIPLKVSQPPCILT